jgi:hypothetical protein
LAGRYIGENSRLLYDIIQYCNEKENPGIILLIDFEKAFDSVSWKFIFKVFKFFFDCGENFIESIKTLLNKPKLCVIQNGIFFRIFLNGQRMWTGGPNIPLPIFTLC